MNPAEIAEQLGHSLQMLLSTYTHVISARSSGPKSANRPRLSDQAGAG